MGSFRADADDMVFEEAPGGLLPAEFMEGAGSVGDSAVPAAAHSSPVPLGAGRGMSSRGADSGGTGAGHSGHAVGASGPLANTQGELMPPRVPGALPAAPAGEHEVVAAQQPDDDDPLEALGGDLPPADMQPPERFEGRKRFPGAAESAGLFRSDAQRTHEFFQDFVASNKRFKRAPREGVRFEARRLQKAIAKEYPAWGEGFVSLSVAICTVFNRRYGDFAPNEFVALSWLALGRTRLMSMDGRLRFFDTARGTWRLYTGIFPEGMFSEFRTFMNRVEGFFRCLDGGSRRDRKAMLEKLAEFRAAATGENEAAKESNLLQRFQSSALWNKAGEREEQEDLVLDDQGNAQEKGGQGKGKQPKPQMPWYVDVATSLRSTGRKLTFELMNGGAVVKNFTEWCSMSITPASGVCYLDRAVKYDVIDLVDGVPRSRPLVVLGGDLPGPGDFFLMALDSSLVPSTNDDEDTETEGPEMTLADPYLLAATEDVNGFLASTFWGNHAGLQACRAALALAKRGQNILQCFIMLGAGGCGLSLFTELIASSLGEDLHKYFDPFVFYDDEELRKCVELLSGGIVFSGQERPQESKKKLLLHLWKNS